MEHYVAGLLIREPNHLLLVRRSEREDRDPGLWSLPAGQVETGESHADALRREFLEETGLVVNVGRHVGTVARASWSVDTYVVSDADSSAAPRLADADIDRLRFAELGNLPERMVLEALVSIQDFRSSVVAVDSAKDYSLLTDRLFSSAFYTRVYGELRSLPNSPLLEVLKWEVTKTPGRKFKSAIPLLLAAATPGVVPYAVVAELMFALWTVLDDVCDDRMVRYGAQTSLAKFGRNTVVALLFGAREEFSKFLCEYLDSETAMECDKALALCAEMQRRRFLNLDSSLESYLNSSRLRSDFLRRVWVNGLRNAGYPLEASFIDDFYPHSAGAAQLINDFYDTQGSDSFHDIADGVMSSYLMIHELLEGEPTVRSLAQMLADGDRNGVSESLWGSGAIEGTRSRAVAALGKVLDMIAKSNLSPEKKVVLHAWQSLPRFRLVPESERDPKEVESTADLISAVQTLTSTGA